MDLKTYFETCDARAASQRTAKGQFAVTAGTVYQNRTSVNAASFAAVPTWTDADILAQFPLTRDNRYMTVPSNPTFQRRISWMFPDNGCFSRAEQVNVKVVQAGKARPYKLFAMGSLHAATTNHANGYIDWAWHVVPVVKNSAGEPIVFDAALSPCKPLPWKTWLLLMVTDLNHFNDFNAGHGVTVAEPNAYTTGSLAQGEPSHETESFNDQIQSFLPLEWDRQVSLGRDPNVVFGNSPLWSGFSCVKVDVVSNTSTIGANSLSSLNVTCPFATKVVGGGGEVASSSQLISKSAKNGNGWQIVVRNNSASNTTISAVAGCLTGAPTSSSVTTVTGTTLNIANGSFNTSTVTCPSGTLISGGFSTTSGSSIMRVYNNRRSVVDANAWIVSAQNNTGSQKSITGYAYCLGGTSFTYSQTSGSGGTASCSSPAELMGGGFGFSRTAAVTLRNLGYFANFFLVDVLPSESSLTGYAECLSHP